MSTRFPSDVGILADSFQVAPSNVVRRTEMDRGVPKQARVQSDVLITVTMKLLFVSKQSIASFEDWFYADAGAGTVWFDWPDPITGIVRSARVVAGSMGPVAPFSGTAGLWLAQRNIQLEYRRALP